MLENEKGTPEIMRYFPLPPALFSNTHVHVENSAGLCDYNRIVISHVCVSEQILHIRYTIATRMVRAVHTSVCSIACTPR